MSTASSSAPGVRCALVHPLMAVPTVLRHQDARRDPLGYWNRDGVSQRATTHRVKALRQKIISAVRQRPAIGKTLEALTLDGGKAANSGIDAGEVRDATVTDVPVALSSGEVPLEDSLTEVIEFHLPQNLKPSALKAQVYSADPSEQRPQRPPSCSR